LPRDAYLGTTGQAAPVAPVTSPSAKPVTAPVPVAIPQMPTTTPIAPTPPGPAAVNLPPTPPTVPGDPFSSAKPEGRTPALVLRDLFAGRTPWVYDFVASQVLDKLSASTEQSVGMNLEDLLHADRTLYKALAPSRDGYVGGQVPLFLALAEGKAAYVNLGKERDADAEHLMRLFSGLPLDTIEKLHPQKEDLKPVVAFLLESARKGEFPVFVDLDGKMSEVSGTESIAAESIASIARRENTFGDFGDPRQFYKWLVTRIESNFLRTDPWLYLAKPKIHDEIGAIKDSLTPPWISRDTKDPFGFRTDPRATQDAYQRIMTICASGENPTVDTLADIADTAIGLDRDLMSGIQSYWIKTLREVTQNQRDTLLRPLARAWVVLNAIGSDQSDFNKVSPDDAPYIELYENSGRMVYERYDRSIALSEVVDHTLAGLGFEQRRHFLGMIVEEIRTRQSTLEAREQRIRGRLGEAYSGLDVGTILRDPGAIDRPEVKRGLDELLTAMRPERDFREMTPEYGEMLRHRDVLKWMAERNLRYGDITVDPLCSHPSFAVDPLIVGEFYNINRSAGVGQVSTLPPGPQQVELLGPAIPGQEPTRMSFVLEGGAGKGFAYIEALRNLKDALRNGPSQVAVDEYVGTSAGAITAGLLACGYREDELGGVMKQVDFKKFYADYLWLMGGVDPKVRGIDRTGMFSAQKMYRMLYDLLSAKLGVAGRPVLFRDLPFKLKVVSTMLNNDLPDDLKRKLNIGADGQIVFSSENTPNMDVVAAICSSAAVPGFFSAPQMQLVRQTNDPARPEVYRMQLMDGGVVNNFPVAEATRDGKAMLASVPTYFEAPPDKPGGRRVRLTTLNFDPADLALIDAYNQKRYAEFAPQLATLIDKSRGESVKRVVLSMNLTIPEAQSAPAIQGEQRAESKKLHQLAQQVGMPVLTPKESRKLVLSNLSSKSNSLLEKLLTEGMLDKDNTFDFALCGAPGYNIPRKEADGVSSLAIGVVAAKMAAVGELEHKTFERD